MGVEHRRRWLVLLWVAALAACGTRPLRPMDEGPLPTDLGLAPDLGRAPDAGLDMGQALPDGGLDAGPDLGPPPCGPEPEPGTVVFVDGRAPAGGDGASWSTALADLRAALDGATEGQEVWVAEGRYTPVVPADPEAVTNAERELSFQIPSGVALLGGFQGDEGRACDRSPGRNTVTLSGDLARDDVDEDGDAIGDANLDDNSYHVVRLDGADPTTRIAGVTITRGNAATGTLLGAGLLNEDGSPHLEDIIFVDNHAISTFGAGGGAASLGGSPRFERATFIHNEARQQGGGLYVSGAGEVHVSGASFIANRGGSAGGGMYVLGPQMSAEVRDTTFQRNRVAQGGGGNGNGGGIGIDAQGATLTRVRFLGNVAEVLAGGLYSRNGDVRVSHAVFADNDGGRLGGALFASSGGVTEVTVQYALIVRNVADRGGAMSARRPLRVDHVTIFGNEARAGSGGALYMNNAEGPGRVYNSIIWGNTASSGSVAFQGNRASSTRSILEASGGSPWDGNPADRGHDGGGNLDVDPMFVDPSDPEGPDGEWGTADDGLRLAPGSPAIDRGVLADLGDIDQDGQRREALPDLGDLDGDGDTDEDVGLDLGGDPRVLGATADLGAYEAAGAAPTPATLHVDVDATGADDGTSWADAFVDLQDALAAAAAGDEVWVAEGTYVPGDERTDAFALRPGVAIYGGFDGTEASVAERDPDPATNGTVLSGEIGGAAATDNIQHVVIASGVGPAAILDGFAIRRGYDFRSGAGGYGGGIYVFSGAPTLRSLLVEGNDAGSGGGAYVAGEAAVRMEECAFVDNRGWEGGGIHLREAELDIVGGLFQQNDGGSGGGGIQNTIDSLLRVSHTVFDRNVSLESGSSPGPAGAGILTTGRAATVGTQLLFVDNHAVVGGGLCAFTQGRVRLSHATFVGNRGVFGGALSVWNASEVDLANGVLFGNLIGTERPNGRAPAILAASNGDRGGTVRVHFSLIEGGIGGAGVDVCARCAVEDVEGNGDGDPAFVAATDPPGMDGVLGTGDDGFRPGLGSAAADTGTGEDVADLDGDGDVAEAVPDLLDVDGDGDRDEAVPTDVAGQPRSVGTAMDIGAYERQP